MSARLRLFLWSAAAILAGGLLLKHFVFDIYRVDSGSMEPTIRGSQEGGERVLVHYGAFQPQRFDPVVVMRAGEEKPVVKRAVGLPNERVQIIGGDLLVDGRRLGISVPRPPPVPVIDARANAWCAAFHAEPANLAMAAGNGMELSAEGDQATRLLLREDVHDDYFDENRGCVRGQQSVNDLLLGVEFTLTPGATAGFELTEQGDVFRAELRPEEGAIRCELLREGDGVLASQLIPSAGRLHFLNVDDTLLLRVDDHEALVVSYPENRLDPRDVTASGRHQPPRVRAWVRHGALKIHALRLYRDLYYTERGDYGRNSALRLGLEECFLLGDNSSASRDGREWGATPLGDILGRPTHVVWPLADLRALPQSLPLEALTW